MNVDSLKIILSKYKEDKLNLDEAIQLINGLSITYYYPWWTTSPTYDTFKKYEITCKNTL